MDKTYHIHSSNNGWGWFVDIEDPITKTYKPHKFKIYSYKSTLPTINEISRNKSNNKLNEVSLTLPGDDGEDDPKKRYSFKIICFAIVFAIITFYIL